MEELALLLKPAVPHRQTYGHLYHSLEILRGAQKSCCTEKFYYEELQTSAYEQPKHHQKQALAHPAKAMHRSEDALGYTW